MEKMYFGTNSLKAIPESISSMLGLIELDFSNNSIDGVPLALAQCVGLEKLHLGKFLITISPYLSFEFLIFKIDAYNFIGNNKIKTIPPEVFSGLTNLKELQLYRNKIATIPSEINALIGIKAIKILPYTQYFCSINNLTFFRLYSTGTYVTIFKQY